MVTTKNIFRDLVGQWFHEKVCVEKGKTLTFQEVYQDFQDFLNSHEGEISVSRPAFSLYFYDLLLQDSSKTEVIRIKRKYISYLNLGLKKTQID